MLAEVAVSLPVRGTFTYRVPAPLAGKVAIGAHVLVPFGARAISGVIVRLSDAGERAGADAQRGNGRHDGADAGQGDPGAGEAADAASIRDIESVLDADISIAPALVELCLWIADYYEAPPGEVLRAALPVGSQAAAAWRVALTDRGRAAIAGDGPVGALSRVQRSLLGTLAQAGGALPRRELMAGRAPRELDVLIDAGLVRLDLPTPRARVRQRSVRWAALARPITDADRAALARAPARLAALAALEAAGGEAPVAALEAARPRIAPALRALAAAGLVTLARRDQDPDTLPAAGGDVPGLSAPSEPPALTPAQAAALAAIRAGLEARAFHPFLLHGVTGSGKTEVYLHAIADVLARGQSAIVLVPEISLTPQLAARFRARFGDRVAVLHSGLSDRERFDEWLRLRGGAARIALGARSAIFAPVTDVGILAVDEEHDASFKQDEGVRYHARDVALVRAQRAGAVCVLGSATPSLESYHAAETGRYRLLDMPERATERPLPEVSVIDLRVYRPETEAMLTSPLDAAIRATVDAGEQVILFLNRRGFSTFVLCVACGHAFRCPDCAVSLTYHQRQACLLCHYCGHRQAVPTACPECRAQGSIQKKGIGTEKVAAAVAERFAPARVDRLDRDVASGPRIGRILGRVARREVDILVGTQMVTKGHDFPGVTLVGVLCADIGLSLPDFRAAERTFQLLTQVAGRAGRGDRPGRVLIQSYHPDVAAIACAAAHDYVGFYRAERQSRADLGFPPLGHLIALRVDGRDAAAVESTARGLAARAEAVRRSLPPGVEVKGPSEAPLARLKGRTRWHVWLRAPDRKLLRRLVRGVVDPGGAVHRGVRISVDVDPVSAM